MDEPSNGLDIPSKSQFRRVVATGMTENKSVVISTHQVRDIDSLLDHVVIIDHSRTLLNQSVSDICSRLCFTELSSGELTGDELFAQPSVHGQSVILPNRLGEEDSTLNLELLFNATLAHPEMMAQVFGK
jgi:ABC-2 type transport system ATP-binding protein